MKNQLNILIDNGFLHPDDARLFFCNQDGVLTDNVLISHVLTLEDLMIEIGAYTSKSKARHAGRVGAIPAGYTEMWANKLLKICVLRPIDFESVV